ncbi:hypothetical protein AXX17_AT2G37840 [Arabidopsis thaliana]|uniref:Uncharacterized protein n=1 Tax=Arabidopsis thaliana TaxID=3702 RepID=A0A178W2L0_ARATH|nr:hypothetical protein AXX17_AT2G37840 [Arabidopsis thaliana]
MICLMYRRNKKVLFIRLVYACCDIRNFQFNCLLMLDWDSNTIFNDLHIDKGGTKTYFQGLSNDVSEVENLSYLLKFYLVGLGT